MTSIRHLVWSFILVIAASAIARPADAGRVDIRLRQGYDSNIFESGTTPGAENVDVYYADVAIGYRARSAGGHGALQLRPWGHFRWHPQTSTGNQFGTSLLLRYRDTFKGRKYDGFRKKTMLTVDLSAGYERQLFLRRSVREELRIGTVSQDLSFGDLPDVFEARIEAASKARLTRRVRLDAGFHGRIRNYSDSSNPMVPTYDKLDDYEMGLRVGTVVEIDRRWDLVWTGTWRNRLYPNRNARTAQGVSVPGEDRNHWFWDGEMAAVFHKPGFRTRAYATIRRRQDRFDGYYAYDQWSVGNETRLRADGGVRIVLDSSFGRRDYDFYGPAGAPISNDYFTLEAQIEKRISSDMRLLFGPHYENTSSNDPVFDVDRLDVYAEVRITR